MEFRLFAFFTCCNVCVLGPVLSCYCYAVPGMTDSVLSFPSCTIAKRGLYSYVCCSVINFPDR